MKMLGSILAIIALFCTVSLSGCAMFKAQEAAISAADPTPAGCSNDIWWKNRSFIDPIMQDLIFGINTTSAIDPAYPAIKAACGMIVQMLHGNAAPTVAAIMAVPNASKVIPPIVASMLSTPVGGAVAAATVPQCASDYLLLWLPQISG